MVKKKGKKPTHYVSTSKSSYNAGFNLGKGQLDKVMPDIKSNELTPSEKKAIETDLLEWGYEYFAGLFTLGKNSDPELKKIWPALRWHLVRNGSVVVIRKQSEEGTYYLLADIHVKDKIQSLKRDLGGRIVELKIVYHNKKDLIGNLVLDEENKEESDFTINDFVIFRNNSQELPELRRGKQQLEKIIKIEGHFLKDLEVSRPRLLAYHPLITSKDKAKMFKEQIFTEANDLITIASLDTGYNPTLHNWPGGSKQADLWNNYVKCLTEWKRLNGMRTMTSKKKQVQLTTEVEMIEEQFEALENNRYDSLAEALEECKTKWNWEWTLLKPDQKEENEISTEIKKLEDLVKIEELKKQLNELKQENQSNVAYQSTLKEK